MESRIYDTNYCFSTVLPGALEVDWVVELVSENGYFANVSGPGSIARAIACRMYASGPDNDPPNQMHLSGRVCTD